MYVHCTKYYYLKKEETNEIQHSQNKYFPSTLNKMFLYLFIFEWMKSLLGNFWKWGLHLEEFSNLTIPVKTPKSKIANTPGWEAWQNNWIWKCAKDQKKVSGWFFSKPSLRLGVGRTNNKECYSYWKFETNPIIGGNRGTNLSNGILCNTIISYNK